MEYSYEIGNSDEFISELMLLIAEKHIPLFYQ